MICHKGGYTRRPKNINGQRKKRQVRKKIQGKNGDTSKPDGC